MTILMRSKLFLAVFLTIIFLFYSSVYSFILTNSNVREINSEDDIYGLYEEGLIEYYDYLYLSDIWENKIDLNQADIDDLIDLPDVDRITAEEIIKYRNENGFFKNISELKKVSVIDDEVYQLIKNFLIIVPDEKGGNLRIRIEENPGDDEGFYVYHRLQYQTGKFKFGYLVERDQQADNYMFENSKVVKGEEKNKFRLEKRFFHVRNISETENLSIDDFIAGNYYLRFGKGVVLSNSGRKEKRGVLPDLSQSLNFYGVTSRVRIYRIALIPFYSNDRFNDNGLPDVYREEVKGLNANIDFGRFFTLGGTYYHSEVKKDFDLDLTGYPDSNKAVVKGIDFSYKYSLLKFAGEFAQVKDKGRGRYLESSYDLKDVSFLTSYRHYDSSFYNPHSQSFAEADDEPDDRDEKGVYFEADFRVIPAVKLKTSFDQWKHPSSLITDRRLKGQINYLPVSFFNLQAERSVSDENISMAGDKDTKSYLQVKFIPKLNFEGAVFYSESIETDTQNKKETDHFYGTQIKLKGENNIFISRIKFSDNDISNPGDKKREYYFYLSHRTIKMTSLNFSFRTIHYSEADVFPNPDEIYKVEMEYYWE